MIEVFFVMVGILLMIYAVFLCRKTILNIENKELRRPWLLLFAFVCFFLLGYVAYVYTVRTGLSGLMRSDLLVAIILAAGALFVVVVLKTNQNLILKLTKNNQIIQDSNKELTAATQTLKRQQRELEHAKELLEDKNRELEQTLEDFYTLRIGMARDLKKGEIEKENQKIKKRLNKLKKRG